MVQHQLLQSDEWSPGYAFGSEVTILRYLSLDLGYFDGGVGRTKHKPTGGLIDLAPNLGQEIWRRAGYALPTICLGTSDNWSFSVGAGPALVETRTRSFGYFKYFTDVSTRATQERHVELMGKVTLRWRFNDSWAALVSGYFVDSGGISNALSPQPGQPSGAYSFRSSAIFAGLQYVTSNRNTTKADRTWSFSAGPAFSRLSYHANYVAHPIGYDFAVRHRWRNGLTLELGRTDYGQVNKTPLKEDGGRLRTPPYSNTSQNPAIGSDLQLEVGASQVLAGFECDVGERFRVGAGLGIAHSVASFFTPQTAYYGQTRFSKTASKWNWVGQARTSWRLAASWSLSLGVRYQEFPGVQITEPLGEAPFGNTLVRTISVLPQLSLRF